MAKRNTTTTTPNAKPRTPKPASTPHASPIDAAVAIARTVTPATIIATVGRAIAGYVAPNRNVGRYTGKRIMDFQNWAFVMNATWQLDDCQLAALWTMEFPSAIGRVFALNGRLSAPTPTMIGDVIGIVRGVRSDYNRTGHGDPNGVPTVKSEPYGSRRFDIAPNVPASDTASPIPATVPNAKPARTGKRRAA